MLNEIVTATAAGWLALAGQAGASPQDPLGPMADQMRNRVGTWCVEARLQFTPQARAIQVDAVAESHLLGERWLVTELHGMEGRTGFHGLGVNGWDSAVGRYTGYWVDNTRGMTIPVEGDYDAAAGVFRTRSVERRAEGGPVTVLSETSSLGPDEELVSFTAPDAEGRPYERMRLHYRRARSAEECADAATP